MIKNKKVLLVSCLFVVLAMGQILSGPDSEAAKKQKKAKKITLNYSCILLGKGKISALTVSAYPVTYKSSDKSIVKVSKKGILQAAGAGTATISIKIKDSVKELVYMTVKVIRDKYDTPLGFDAYNDKIPHGKMTEVSYSSSVTGNTRKCMVYTPPGYSTAKKYNVLYCMHGIGGDHREWYAHGSPLNILDNLYAEDKLADIS